MVRKKGREQGDEFLEFINKMDDIRKSLIKLGIKRPRAIIGFPIIFHIGANARTLRLAANAGYRIEGDRIIFEADSPDQLNEIIEDIHALRELVKPPRGLLWWRKLDGSE